MARMKDLQIENHNRLCLLPLIRDAVHAARALSDTLKADDREYGTIEAAERAANECWLAGERYYQSLHRCNDAVGCDPVLTRRIYKIIDSFVDWYEPKEPDYAGGITAWDD